MTANADHLAFLAKRCKFKLGDTIPGWACKAKLDIIENSAKQLVELVNFENWKYVLLPRPGCGAGELKWTDVQNILNRYFDDRFYIITFLI